MKGGDTMSPLEIKRYTELENEYKTVINWHRIYGCTENGEIINGMVYIVNGHAVETIWEK